MIKIKSKDKKFWIKIITGLIILSIIVVYGFSFVLYEGNVAVITRFGAPRVVVEDAGLHLKLTWPFEKVYTFDKRQQYYDTSYIETLTKDKKNIILQTYIVWKIEDALKFLQSTGTVNAAESNLDSLVTNAKNGVLGKYELSALVSTNPEELRLSEIEENILTDVQEQAKERYGICVSQVGLEKIGLPEANTKNVFEQMKAERQKYVEQLKAEGERDANILMSEADVKAAELLAEGTEESSKIRGEAELEAAKIYSDASRKNPEFYSFLRKLDSTEKILGEKSLLIFSSDTAPFDVLNEGE